MYLDRNQFTFFLDMTEL